MMRASSPPPPSELEVVSVLPTRPLSPRGALAAIYSTYVVRVHTRHGIKTISFDVLAALFTYTAKKAAEDLGISSRTLIRVCRSLGIRRWPYLGFRSEKNVERIRQEAIENLRRKLERESSEAAASCSSASSSSSASHHASASCLRGASAKRLLQVKLPFPHVGIATRAFERPSVFGAQAAPTGHVTGHIEGELPVDHDGDLVMHYHHPQHSHPPHHSPSHYATQPPLPTPPPSHHSFDLGMRPSGSPRRLPHVTSFRKHMPASPASPSSASSAASSAVSSPSSSTHAPSAMPSLNVLLEASMLTAFKHEVETHLARPSEPLDTHHHPAARTMSMRDILNNAPMAA